MSAPLSPERLTASIRAALSHDNLADNIRASIGLLRVIERQMPIGCADPIYEAIRKLKDELYEAEPVPTVEHAHEWLDDHIGVRTVRCQCGCVIDWADVRTVRCDRHRPRPMGSLPTCVERDLAGVIRD